MLKRTMKFLNLKSLSLSFFPYFVNKGLFLAYILSTVAK